MVQTKIVQGILLLFLGINSIRDIRKREIFLPLTLTGIAAGGLYTALTEGFTRSRICAVGIGSCFIAVSMLSSSQFGMGDALALTLLGMVLSPEELVFVLGLSFFLAFLVSAFLLLKDKATRKERIPFLPFLLAGYLGEVLLW